MSAPCARFPNYDGLGSLNRKYLEMQFLCTYVGIVSIMAFEMCTCSWKANVYTPIFLLFSTKKALYYSQNRDPKVLQCIYHILDSGHGTYVKKSFPITYYPILCTYFFVAMETGVSNSVLITALKSRSTILDKVSQKIHRNSQIFCNSNNIGSAISFVRE